MPYPNLLAGGMTPEGTFLPFELFAGESDIVTDRGVIGATPITQFQVIARGEDGLLVPWSGVAGAASKAGTFSAAGTAADTITVNGIVFTLQTSLNTAHDVVIGATATETAANFAAKVNAAADDTNVTAVAVGPVVTLTAVEPGVGGNSIAISEASTSFSFAGGATALSGGASQRENRAIGIAAQAGAAGVSIPYFTAGVFNHEVLGWPAGVTTLAQRQAVFDRTNIGVAKLLGSTTPMTLP